MRITQDLYESDLYKWALTNAKLLRNGLLEEIDSEHIADELEDMGKREKRELKNQIERLILHLLKYRFQPEKRTASWRSSIINSREEIQKVFDESPSLKSDIPSFVKDLYSKCIKSAIRETGLKPEVFPISPPFSQEEILSENFWPESDGEGISSSKPTVPDPEGTCEGGAKTPES